MSIWNNFTFPNIWLSFKLKIVDAQIGGGETGSKYVQS